MDTCLAVFAWLVVSRLISGAALQDNTNLADVCAPAAFPQCSISEAARQCKHQWMREALQAWVRRRGWDESLAAASASGGSVGAGVSTGVQQQAPEVASAGDGEIRFGSTSLHFGDDSRAFDFKAAAAAAAVGPCVSSNST